MEPRLSAITGPLQGAVFSCANTSLTIGRAPHSAIYLSDPLVSRQHCTLTELEGHFWLRDDNSSNGTLVNDVPIRERQLADGDRIQVGSSIFFFLLEASEPKRPTVDVLPAENSALPATTLIVLPENNYYGQAAQQAVPTVATEQLLKNLNILLEISAVLNQVHELEQLPAQLMQAIFAVTPAERGALLLTRDYFDQSDLISWHERETPNLTKRFRLSQTVLHKVRAERVALLCNEIQTSPTFSKAKSLVDAPVQSILAVPLICYEKLLGVIYLEIHTAMTVFAEDHLQLVMAIARFSAFAFDNLLRIDSLTNENQRLNQEINFRFAMVGESPAMKAVYQTLQRAAATDSTVLLLGESGTGKELAARALHQHSPRAKEPFVAINCAGLSSTLLESDLFGHEKGAFTGAVATKKGKMEIANGGTLFLDELGELPMDLQAKLLRALQEREFERVGSTRPIKTDFRLVAATNRDLPAAIEAGSFRADLYYRVNVIPLTMPPLRERDDDILLLANYFTLQHAQKCKRTLQGIAPDAKKLLLAYDWPGNVRELENAIERAVVLGTSELIRAEDLPETLCELPVPTNVTVSSYHQVTREAKQQLIIQTLAKTKGNYTEAAAILGIHRNNLHRLIKNLGIKDQLKD